MPGQVGLVQATEVIKLILGVGTSLKGKLFIYDALDLDFRVLTLQKNPSCPLCGEHPTITGLVT